MSIKRQNCCLLPKYLFYSEKSFRLPQGAGTMDSVMMRRAQTSVLHTPVRNCLFCFLLGAVSPQSALAQTFMPLADGIPVERNGAILYYRGVAADSLEKRK